MKLDILGLSDHFVSCEFVWCPRQSNLVSDCIAKHAKNGDFFAMWPDFMPHHVLHLVLNDVSTDDQ